MKKYNSPELEVIELDVADVIATSNPNDPDNCGADKSIGKGEDVDL